MDVKVMKIKYKGGESLNKRKKMYTIAIILQFLIPYLIVLSIPVAIGLITYDKTLELISGQVLESNLMTLRHNRDLVDQSLDEVELVAQKIINNSKVSAFKYLENPFSGRNTYQILELQQQLKNYSLEGSIASNYYLLFSNSQLAINHNETYHLDDLYNQKLTYISKEVESWKQDFVTEAEYKYYLPVEDVVIDDEPVKMVTYLQSLGHVGQQLGSLMILIEHKKLQELLGGVNVSEGGWAYIMNEEGKIMASVSDETSIPITPFKLDQSEGMLMPSEATQNMFVTYTSSPKHGWTYVLVQPKHVVWKKVDFIRNLTLAILVIGLVIGFAIALLLAYRTSRPVRHMVEQVIEQVEGKPGLRGSLRFIQHAVSGLLDKQEHLRRQLAEQHVVLKSHVVERLLRGEFDHEQDMVRMAEHYEIPLSGDHYRVLIIDCNPDSDHIVQPSISEIDQRRVKVKKLMSRLPSHDMLFHDVQGGKIACLLIGKQSNEHEMESQLADRLTEWESLIAPTSPLIIAIGGKCNHVVEISRSFEEAKQALDMKNLYPDRKILHYTAYRKSYEGYVYPLESEQKLLQLTKEGKKQDVTKLLDQLYHKNIVQLQLPMDIQRLFVLNVWGSLIKLLQQNVFHSKEELAKVQGKLNAIQMQSDFKQIYASIKELFCKVAEHSNQEKQKRQHAMAEKMMQYIDEHFHKSELSLRMFAEKFKISEVYASQMFKELTGINFFEYVEEKRMEHARKLLTETQESVNHIAMKVGYLSANTFCRAFKRKHMQSPTIYRKLNMSD